MVLSQAEAVQREIRDHFDELLEQYRVGDGFEVPVAVKLASGRKRDDRRSPARRARIRLVSTPSFTGSEEACARVMQEELRALGLQVQWQQVEDGRANVLGTWPGAGGGPTLMFNGHLDTSYSGREPWLAGIPGFQPQGSSATGASTGSGSRT